MGGGGGGGGEGFGPWWWWCGHYGKPCKFMLFLYDKFLNLAFCCEKYVVYYVHI